MGDAQGPGHRSDSHKISTARFRRVFVTVINQYLLEKNKNGVVEE